MTTPVGPQAALVQRAPQGALLLGGLGAVAWSFVHGYPGLFGPLAVLLVFAAVGPQTLARVAALTVAAGCSLLGAVQVSWGQDSADRVGGAVLLLLAAIAFARWHHAGRALLLPRATWGVLVVLALIAVALAVAPLSAGDGHSCGSAIAPQTFTTVPGDRPASPQQIELFVRGSECDERVTDRRGAAGSVAVLVAFWAAALLVLRRASRRTSRSASPAR